MLFGYHQVELVDCRVAEIKLDPPGQADFTLTQAVLEVLRLAQILEEHFIGFKALGGLQPIQIDIVFAVRLVQKVRQRAFLEFFAHVYRRLNGLRLLSLHLHLLLLLDRVGCSGARSGVEGVDVLDKVCKRS